MDANRNPLSTNTPILVRSHVARDLLQSAALFKTDRLVLCEYISNGLQYVEPGTIPQIRVKLDKKTSALQFRTMGAAWTGQDWKIFS